MTKPDTFPYIAEIGNRAKYDDCTAFELQRQVMPGVWELNLGALAEVRPLFMHVRPDPYAGKTVEQIIAERNGNPK